jgi:hypothetical protein
MIGVSLQVSLPGEMVVVPVTPRAAVNFERHFKMSLTKAITEQQMMEHIYYLAWECIRLSGRVVKPFDGWLEEVEQVTFVMDSEPAPLDATG